MLAPPWHFEAKQNEDERPGDLSRVPEPLRADLRPQLRDPVRMSSDIRAVGCLQEFFSPVPVCYSHTA